MVGILGLSGSLAAQSPDWSSVLTITPSPSPYLSDWERVPSTALLTLTYTGAAPADFRVRVSLTSAERGSIAGSGIAVSGRSWLCWPTWRERVP